MHYGQFCPIAKTAEIFGERWTILIVREILCGGRRFNELVRGLGDISPAMLTSRLKSLEADGLIARRRIPGQRGFEYWPTEACERFLPIIVSMGEWGLCWARDNLEERDYDVSLLMLYLERSVDTGRIPGDQAVIRFHFTDAIAQPDWWLLVDGDKVDTCYTDPGRDVDIFLTTTVRAMSDLWMGDRDHRQTIASGELEAVGEQSLVRNMKAWLKPSIFADAPRQPQPLVATP